MNLPLSPSDYGQLRAFAAVAEALNFSRAAETLAVTPSALSQTIRQLEQSLGTQLLRRTTRRVSLTPAGQQLLQHIQPAIGALGEALRQLQHGREQPSGLLRIHAFRSGASRYLEPMLAEFLNTYPDIVLDITLDDEVVDLVGGGFDASIRLGEVIEQDMIALPLGPPLRQIAVAAPAYLRRHGSPATPRDLAAHRCIRWRWPGRRHPYRWEFCENGRWFEIGVQGPLIVNDKQLVIEAALQGLGIAFCMEAAVSGHLRAARLMPLLEAWSEPFPGIHLCYPRQRQMAPALRVFIDAMRQYAQTLEHEPGRSGRPRPAPADLPISLPAG